MVLPALVLAALMLIQPPAPAPAFFHLYIGATDGIYLAQVDVNGDWVGDVTRVASAPNPNFLAASVLGRHLYAAQREKGHEAVAAYAIDPQGKLTLLNTVPTGQNGGCHLSLSGDERTLLLANYESGTVQSFHVFADGKIGACLSTIPFTGSGPNQARQLAPHAHSIYVAPDNRFVYACDLGSDRIWIFRLENEGHLIANDPPSASVPPGSGPRHLAFSVDGKFVYVANEMGVSVSVFARNEKSGALRLLQSVSCLPSGTSITGVTTAEVFVSATQWLYVSNRGPDNLSVFAIGEDGRLTFRDVLPLRPAVQGPRSFALGPLGVWLVVAGQTSNSLGHYDMIGDQLLKSPTYRSVPASPLCVVIDYRPISAPKLSRHPAETR